MSGKIFTTEIRKIIVVGIFGALLGAMLPGNAAAAPPQRESLFISHTIEGHASDNPSYAAATVVVNGQALFDGDHYRLTGSIKVRCYQNIAAGAGVLHWRANGQERTQTVKCNSFYGFETERENIHAAEGVMGADGAVAAWACWTGGDGGRNPITPGHRCSSPEIFHAGAQLNMPPLASTAQDKIKGYEFELTGQAQVHFWQRGYRVRITAELKGTERDPEGVPKPNPGQPDPEAGDPESGDPGQDDSDSMGPEERLGCIEDMRVMAHWKTVPDGIEHSAFMWCQDPYDYGDFPAVTGSGALNIGQHLEVWLCAMSSYQPWHCSKPATISPPGKRA
ncbi:hypothetical protein [Amycolatopsis minnesotensis]|uniref:Uncharacterized protein n=1 Tax=Amycolatopsis minnesotensis TaxID=337894 RepID=A0ABP5CY48_9PSEU